MQVGVGGREGGAGGSELGRGVWSPGVELRRLVPRCRSGSGPSVMVPVGTIVFMVL